MIFIDTNVFVAAHKPNDEFHERSLKLIDDISKDLHGSPVTSDYVFDETVTTVLSRTGRKDRAIQVGEYILSTTGFAKVHNIMLQNCWDMFKSNDLGLSFTDCSNIEIMREMGIRKIATFDKAFKKVKGIEVIS